MGLFLYVNRELNIWWWRWWWWWWWCQHTMRPYGSLVRVWGR